METLRGDRGLASGTDPRGGGELPFLMDWMPCRASQSQLLTLRQRGVALHGIQFCALVEKKQQEFISPIIDVIHILLKKDVADETQSEITY